jgi:PAT family beta-lactamase induction signal transducer AmpG
MQAVDGQGYRIGGLAGGLMTDASLSLIACAVLLPLVALWLRRDQRTTLAPQLAI